MAFFYGGGWTQGSADNALYWGNYYANSSTYPVVLVTANYRLGALGFLATDTLQGIRIRNEYCIPICRQL